MENKYLNTQTHKILSIMESITAVIIEDIPEEMETLRMILEEEFPQIVILGTANSAESAVELIERTRPMLLFMDIKLGGDVESFDVIKQFYEKGFKRFIPIFMTAYGSESYAIEAMKYANIGARYFKKPISNEMVRNAVEGCLEQLVLNTFNFDLDFEKMQQILMQIKKRIAPESIFVSVVGGGEVRVNMEDVLYLQSDGSVTYFYLLNKNRNISFKGSIPYDLASNQGLKLYDDCFTRDYNFYRIHNSILVNLDHIVKHKMVDNEYVFTLTNGEQIKGSRRRVDAFKDEFDKLNPTKKSWIQRIFSRF